VAFSCLFYDVKLLHAGVIEQIDGPRILSLSDGAAVRLTSSSCVNIVCASHFVGAYSKADI